MILNTQVEMNAVEGSTSHYIKYITINWQFRIVFCF